ncbi:MAG: hypothetical protein WCK26_03385 [Candidatus Saccharibacteria bacterium]
MQTIQKPINDYVSEAFVQELIRDEPNVKKYIIDNLGYNYDGTERFVREVKYINGITVDYKIVKDNEVIALLECKSGGINVTDYVRGIGQLLQYEYFREENITQNDEIYSDDFKTVYFYPSDVIKNNSFNISTFKYPETTQLLEVNIENFVVRSVDDKELERIHEVWIDKSAVSQYYFRDNRLFELYGLLQYLKNAKNKGVDYINRSALELNVLRKFETPNNHNWRNAFITLSSLGFISSNNLPNLAGELMASKSYTKFCLEIFKAYIRPYASTIMVAMKNNPNISLMDLASNINAMFGGKPVLFITDSSTRYLSSWLNIFRDDFGFIDFTARSSDRTIVYDPFNLSDEDFEENIISYNKASDYLKRINYIIDEMEIT